MIEKQIAVKTLSPHRKNNHSLSNLLKNIPKIPIMRRAIEIKGGRCKHISSSIKVGKENIRKLYSRK